MRRALEVLFRPEDVIELRALRKRGKYKDAIAGYYDGVHRADLIEEAVRLNESGFQAYTIFNALDPQLLGRCANRMEPGLQATADANILRRRWLLIDADPRRPEGVSATAEQLQAARAVAQRIRAFLRERGWPDPVIALSGNGIHLLFRIDLPNDEASAALVKGCLEVLAEVFDDDDVKIDRVVGNASRITKLYGTVASKGDHLPATPWRLSRLGKVPDPIGIVSVEQLQALVAEAGTWGYEESNSHDRDYTGEVWTPERMQALLDSREIEAADPEAYEGGLRWKVTQCPFNPEHVNSAAVILTVAGKPIYKCQHNSCENNWWDEFCAQVGATHEQRAYTTASAGEPGSVSPAENTADEGWPEDLPEEAYHGLFGDITRAVVPHTEADPAALLLQTVVAFGTYVGRKPYVQVEGDQHYPHLYVVLVGATAKARKGTAWGRTRQVFSGLADFPEVVSGLSTGEGLKYHVRDERWEKQYNKKTKKTEVVLVDAGVADKRLLVIEPEFARVLRQQFRTGNTLSPTTREAWDTGNLRTLTKNDPVRATGAHISIIGHITLEELRTELTATDQCNGFANRFLFVCTRRAQLLPFGGGALPLDVLQRFCTRITDAAAKARERGAIDMTQAARGVWEAVYPKLSEGLPGLVGAVTARAEAQCIRLALHYALADGADQIDRPHLLAAIAVWERSASSARHVFGTASGDRVEDEILRALKMAAPDGLTRTAISYLFQRHEPAGRIGAALERLAKRGRAHRVLRRSNGGRPAEIWAFGAAK
jgi:hypothetical protein